MTRPLRWTQFRFAAIVPLLALVLAGCSAAGGGASPDPADGPGYGGMMGGAVYGGMMGGRAPGAAPLTSVDPATEARLERTPPAGAIVDRATNTVTFTGQVVAFPVLAAPADGPDETFRVAGLTNPTIVVSAGARITLELVNADAGMPHDWELTASPLLASMPMMNPPVFGAITETLPDASSSAMPATTIAFDASAPGRYTYLCTVPGHAQAGMYGTFLVQGS